MVIKDHTMVQIFIKMKSKSVVVVNSMGEPVFFCFPKYGINFAYIIFIYKPSPRRNTVSYLIYNKRDVYGMETRNGHSLIAKQFEKIEPLCT